MTVMEKAGKRTAEIAPISCLEPSGRLSFQGGRKFLLEYGSYRVLLTMAIISLAGLYCISQTLQVYGTRRDRG